jgi:hypothetical protein
MELRNLSPDNFTKIEAMRRIYEDALDDILRAGEADGQFTIADSRITTMGLIALLTGVSNWYRDDGRLSVGEIEKIYWDMVRKSVSA